MLKVSYGTNHSMMLGRFPGLDPTRRRWPWTKAFLGEVTETVDGMGGEMLDGICFFTRWTDVLGRNQPDPPWVKAAYDEHGCRLELDTGRGESSLGGTNVAHQSSSVYPRRASEFEVELGRLSDEKLHRARMRVRNPSPWRGLDWIAEALPASRKVEDLTVTLVGYGNSERSPWPQFRVEAEGQVRPEWRAARTFFRDVTGNESQMPWLCRHETAWQIEAWFERIPGSDFGPEESMTVVAGVFPGSGEARVLEGSRTLHGMQVGLLGLGGPGRFRWERAGTGPWRLISQEALAPGVTGDGSSAGTLSTGEWRVHTSMHPWVRLALKSVDPGHSWKVVARDSEGKWHENWGWRGHGGIYDVAIDVPEGVVVQEVKVLVQRYRKVSFIVRPPRAEPP